MLLEFDPIPFPDELISMQDDEDQNIPGEWRKIGQKLKEMLPQTS